jgi:hypothetical protein
MPKSEHEMKIKSNTRVDIREKCCKDLSGWEWLKIVFLVSAILDLTALVPETSRVSYP